jgi:hypothetical protein
MTIELPESGPSLLAAPGPIAVVALVSFGGEGEIRTHETREGLPVFKTGAFNRSATSPSKPRNALSFYRSSRIGRRLERDFRESPGDQHRQRVTEHIHPGAPHIQEDIDPGHQRHCLGRQPQRQQHR